MPEEASNRETIAIDENVHEIYKQLTEGNYVQSVPFRTMKDVFMWAVCLGVQKNKRKSLTGKKMTVFRWAQFDAQIDIPLLKAIAIAESGDVSILLKRNEILALVEEYANAGIYDLSDILTSDFGQPLWNLVKIIQ